MAADDNQALLLQVSADISKLEKAFAKASGTVDSSASFMERRAKQLGRNLEGSLNGQGFGKALEKVFDSSRLTVLEEGGAKLRLFGSALEPLGALGIAAAGGVLAFSLAMERTDKAIEAAAHVAKLGKELGVSTDFVQEFTFALRENEIEIGTGSEALKKLNENLGNVKDGLAKKTVANAFGALGLTPTALKGFHDAGELLPVLAQRIAAVGDASEKAGIAKKLGVAELLPLLKDGADGFNALAQRARDLGVVLDHDLIAGAEEAKKKLNELDEVMKAKATATFAEFADTLIAVKTAFQAAERAGLSFLATITNTLPAAERLKALRERRDALESDPVGQALRDAVIRATPGVTQLMHGPTGNLAEVNKQINALELAQINARLKEQDQLDAGNSGKPPKSPPGKTAKTDRTAAAIEASLAKEDQAHAALLQALLAQTTDLETQLGLVRQITQAEKDRVDAETAKRLVEVAAAKDIKATAKIGIEANFKKAAEDEKAAIDAKAIRETIDLQLKNARLLVDHQAAQIDSAAGLLEAQAQLAVTLKERAALEAAALKLRQEAERSRAEQTLAEAFARGDQGGINRAADDIGAIKARQAQDTKSQAVANAGPIADYIRSIQDLDTVFQDEAVTAARGLSTALVQSAGDMHKFGSAVLSIVRNLLAQAAAAALQKEVIGPILAALPAFADGTDYAPGGLAIVGERGPEAVRLPRGSQVVPNSSLAAMANLAAPRGSQVTVLQPIHADFTGAVVTQDLMDSFRNYANAVGARAALAGAQLGKSQALDTLRASTRNRLGR